MTIHKKVLLSTALMASMSLPMGAVSYMNDTHRQPKQFIRTDQEMPTPKKPKRTVMKKDKARKHNKKKRGY